MKRVFTFGCSYTSYSWPTWSNMLEIDFDHVENWALSGIGNRAIAERIAEAHAKQHITKDDVVIVQWSSHLRNDWWHQESMPERTLGWKTYGSIFNYHNVDLYDEKWLRTFFYEPAYFMHTLNNIILVQNMLDGIGCKWYMTSMGDIRDMGTDMRDKSGYGEKTELTAQWKPSDSINKDGSHVAWKMLPDLKVYNKTIWEDHADHWLMPMELFCQTCPELTYDFVDGVAEKFVDLHPSPAQHALWLETQLKDKIDIPDSTFVVAKELVDGLKPVHAKFKYNKSAFEFSLAKKTGFPASTEKMTWPGRPLGY